MRVWDPATGHQERELTGHTDGVNAVCAVTVDGRALLASASDDRTVRLWDAGHGQAVLTIRLRDQPRAVTSHHPQTLFIGLDNGVVVIQLATAQPEE